MVSLFDEFNVMLQKHPFHKLTLSETQLKNDANLLNYIQISGSNSLAARTEMKEEESVSVYISKIRLNTKLAMISTRQIKVSNICESSVKETAAIKDIQQQLYINQAQMKEKNLFG